MHGKPLLAALVLFLGGCVDTTGDASSESAGRSPGTTQATESTARPTPAEVAPVEAYNKTLRFASPGGSNNAKDSFVVPPQPSTIELRWVERRDCPVGYARGQSFVVEDETGNAHTFHPVGTGTDGATFSWECVEGPSVLAHGPDPLTPIGGQWTIRLYGACMCAVEIAILVTPRA